MPEVDALEMLLQLADDVLDTDAGNRPSAIAEWYDTLSSDQRDLLSILYLSIPGRWKVLREVMGQVASLMAEDLK